MRSPCRLAVFLLLVLLLVPLAGAQPERPAEAPDNTGNAIDYEGVLRLLKQGVDEKEILKQLQASTTHFTLSGRQIGELKDAGASSHLIEVMHQLATQRVQGDVANVAIVLDCSGSMREKMPDGTSKMDTAKKVVKRFIRDIPEGKNLAFIVYGTDPKNHRCEDVEVHLPLTLLTKDVKDQLDTYIDGLQPVGFTPLALGMQKAGAELARDSGLSLLLVITDGMESCNGDPGKVAEQLVRDLNLANGVNVVYLPGAGPEERQALEDLQKPKVFNLFTPESTTAITGALVLSRKTSEAEGQSRRVKKALAEAGTEQTRLSKNLDQAQQAIKTLAEQAPPKEKGRVTELAEEETRARKRLIALREDEAGARLGLDQLEEEGRHTKDFADLAKKVDAQKEHLSDLAEKTEKEKSQLVAWADEAGKLRDTLLDVAGKRLTTLLDEAGGQGERLSKNINKVVEEWNSLAKTLNDTAKPPAGEKDPLGAVRTRASKEHKHVEELADTSDTQRDQLKQLRKDVESKARPPAQLSEEVGQAKTHLAELADDAEQTATRLTALSKEALEIVREGPRKLLTQALNEAANQQRRLAGSLAGATVQLRTLTTTLEAAAKLQGELGERGAGEKDTLQPLRDRRDREQQHLKTLTDDSAGQRERLLQLGKDQEAQARPVPKLTEEAGAVRDRLTELADDAEQTATRLTTLADDAGKEKEQLARRLAAREEDAWKRLRQTLAEARDQDKRLSKGLDSAREQSDRLTKAVKETADLQVKLGEQAAKEKAPLAPLRERADTEQQHVRKLSDEADSQQNMLSRLSKEADDKGRPAARMNTEAAEVRDGLTQLADDAEKTTTGLAALADEVLREKDRIERLIAAAEQEAKKREQEARKLLGQALSDAATQHRRLGKALDRADMQSAQLAKNLQEAATELARLGERAPGARDPLALLREKVRKERNHAEELADASDSQRERLIRLDREAQEPGQPLSPLTAAARQVKDRLVQLADDTEQTATRLTALTDDAGQQKERFVQLQGPVAELCRLPQGFQVTHMALAPDRKVVTLGGSSDTVLVLDLKTGEPVARLEGNVGGVSDLFFSPNGALLIMGCGKQVKLWNTSSWQMQKTLEGHDRNLVRMGMLPNSELLASADEGGKICVWDLSRGELHKTLKGHDARVTDLLAALEGKLLTSADEKGTVCVWQMPEGELRWRGTQLGKSLSRYGRTKLLVWAGTVPVPNSDPPASHGIGNQVYLYDLLREGAKEEDHRLAKIIYDPANPGLLINDLTVSPDGRILVTCGDDHRVLFWDAESGKPLPGSLDYRNKGFKHTPGAAFSPDGSTLVTCNDGILSLWEVPAWKEKATMGEMSNDGTIWFLRENRFASQGKNPNVLKVWDAATGKELGELPVNLHDSAVLRWSRDAGLLCLTTKGGVVKLYHMDRLLSKLKKE